MPINQQEEEKTKTGSCSDEPEFRIYLIMSAWL